MSDLVTGEAVVLELRLAKFASRSLAIVIDFAIQFTALFAFFVIVGSLAPVLDEAALRAVALTGIVLVLVGYFVAMESLTRGRTVGKMAMGLRVVRDDGGPIRFRHALARGLATIVDFWLLFGSVALVTSLASSRGKRVGDLLAGTVVVRERVPVRGAPIAQMPPPLAGWARELQMSRLPDDLALATRQFLARTHELAPEARHAMAGRLAGEVARYVSPPPPSGTPPEPYLAAVLVERRAREAARLAGPMPYPPPGSPPASYPHGPYPAAGYPPPTAYPPQNHPQAAHAPAPSRAQPPPAAGPYPGPTPWPTPATTRYEQPTVPYERPVSTEQEPPTVQPAHPETERPEGTAPRSGFAPPA